MLSLRPWMAPPPPTDPSVICQPCALNWICSNELHLDEDTIAHSLTRQAVTAVGTWPPRAVHFHSCQDRPQSSSSHTQPVGRTARSQQVLRNCGFPLNDIPRWRKTVPMDAIGLQRHMQALPLRFIAVTSRFQHKPPDI